MALRDQATEVIVGLDPRRAAEGTLRLLMPHLCATASGLFRVEGESLSLFVGCSIDQRDLDRSAEAWADGKLSILAGHAYTDDRFALVPVSDAGVIYLRADGRLDLAAELLDQVMPFLAAALGPGPHALQPPMVVDVEATPTSDFDRERLVVLLQRHEWNIARVARILQVERSTVYRRMERWGIPRHHVRKT